MILGEFDVATRFGDQILHEDTKASEVTVDCNHKLIVFLISRGPVDLS